MASKIKNLYW
jgi:hypothetical protein